MFHGLTAVLCELKFRFFFFKSSCVAKMCHGSTGCVLLVAVREDQRRVGGGEIKGS